MSAEGIRAAKWIGRVQPKRAAVLAAEIRNAITAASLAVGDVDTDSIECAVCSSIVGGKHDCARESIDAALEDIRGSVAHVLAIADALQPGGVRSPLPEDDGEPNGELTGRQARAELPTVPEREREARHITNEYGDCVHWCPACGPVCKHGDNSFECEECKAERRKIAPPDRDSSGGHEVPHVCAWCGLPILGGDGVMQSEQWYHGLGGCRSARILDAGRRAEAYEAHSPSHRELANEAQDIGDDAAEQHHRAMARRSE